MDEINETRPDLAQIKKQTPRGVSRHCGVLLVFDTKVQSLASPKYILTG